MTSTLEAVSTPVASAVSTGALVAGVLAFAVTRRPGLGLSVFLDLLLAAGLLRLIGEPDWGSIVTTAAIVALRRLIGVGLRIGGRSWASTATNTAPSGWSRAARRLLHPAWRA